MLTNNRISPAKFVKPLHIVVFVSQHTSCTFCSVVVARQFAWKILSAVRMCGDFCPPWTWCTTQSMWWNIVRQFYPMELIFLLVVDWCSCCCWDKPITYNRWFNVLQHTLTHTRARAFGIEIESSATNLLLDGFTWFAWRAIKSIWEVHRSLHEKCKINEKHTHT